MGESIRRCRPLLRRSADHENDAHEVALRLCAGRWIATDAGVFSPALARYILESSVEELVDAGLVVRVDDPDGFATFSLRGA